MPRSELCGALLVSRLMVSVVIALSKLDESPTGAIMILDSRCTISSLELTSSKMLPFFQNRLAEIKENLDTVAKWCEVEPVHWVESDLNPADLLTRGTVSLKDIGPGSFHQTGPNFLSSSRDKWPITRDFVPVEIPEEEMRKKNFFAALRTEGLSPVLMLPDDMARQVEIISEYSNCINRVHRIMARVLRGWGKPVIEKLITNPKALTEIAVEPSGGEIETARNLLLIHAMTLTEQALAGGRLDSLLPVWQGKILVTTGRLGDRNMMRLFGVKSLPILMPNSRVAYLYNVPCAPE